VLSTVGHGLLSARSSAWPPLAIDLRSRHFGQVVAIIPSERLVVARFGVMHIEPSADTDGIGRLVAEVRSALGRGRDRQTGIP